MARAIRAVDLAAIEDAIRPYPEGATAPEVARALKPAIPRRTLQYRLKYLLDQNRLIKEGDDRWAKYRLSPAARRGGALPPRKPAAVAIPLSPSAGEIQADVSRPLAARKPTGYHRDFLETYRPNVTAYLADHERAHLRQTSAQPAGGQPAGTYARQILDRLLIDLSWNSSRLEGNNYSLLDTKRLIEFGQEAEGKDRLDAQMILNHKDAIEFLVSGAAEIDFNRYTILNLHAVLANNLLADPTAAGRLRRIAVGIEKSVYHPLEVPQLIEECFEQLLETTAAIKDPFEQAFFVMVQLPYLQPFDDVNKRVSRLAANIPFIKANLVPLSFTDVPRAIYTDAMLGVYELNKIDLLKDVFIWAYERSVARYAAVRQSLGEPDPFKLKYRTGLRQLIGEVVRGRMARGQASAHIAEWAQAHVDASARDMFREIAENELVGLHEGNFARFQIRPAEFSAWQKVWNA